MIATILNSLSPLVSNHYLSFIRYNLIQLSLATLEQTYLIPSRTLSPHARFYVREMRILAYSQLLESYRSLTLESLSGAFGVSVEFVDRSVKSS